MVKLFIDGLRIGPCSNNARAFIESFNWPNDLRAGNSFWLDKLEKGKSVYVDLTANHPYILTMARKAVLWANKKHVAQFKVIKSIDLIEICRIK